MRVASVFLLLAGACSSAGVPRSAPEDPAVLADLLAHDDPLRREEAAHRLTLLRRSVHQALADRDPALLEVVNRDTSSMRASLTAALEGGNPEYLVYRAYHILRGGCIGREWGHVAGELGRQRFQLVEIYEPDDRTKFVRFSAQPAAYVNSGGDRHDLFFWVKASQLEAGRWLVVEVYVGLHVVLEAAFKSLASSCPYAPGSVLERFFQVPALRKRAAVYPLVEELEFTYGRIRDRESKTIPAGFHVNASLVRAKRDLGGGQGVFYTAASGLDPVSTPEGALRWEGFVSSPAIGPLIFRGSRFWGAGGLRPENE